MNWRDGATLLLLVLAAAGWFGHAHRAVPASLAEVAREMAMVSPELWPLPLPGLRLEWPPLHEGQQNRVRELGLDLRLITGEGGREAVEREQLRAVMPELPAIWGEWPTPGFRTGAAQLVLRLAAPGAHPRAIVALRGGTAHGRGILYLVEQRTDGWRTERLDSLAEHVAILDLDADLRPEVVASSPYGSGHFLHLNIFAWDDQTVRKVFTYGGRGESGPFGCLLRPDGVRDLWLEEPPWGGGERGLFTAPPVATHGPFLRDRVFWCWEGGRYQPAGRARVATPFYFLNRYLYLAGRREWAKTAAYAEPGAAIDRQLAAALGHGPFRGGRDDGFVNGRMYVWKGEEPFYADFGPTGRLLRLGRGAPGLREEVGSLRALPPPPPGEYGERVRQLARQLDFPLFAPGWLPPGYAPLLPRGHPEGVELIYVPVDEAGLVSPDPLQRLRLYMGKATPAHAAEVPSRGEPIRAGAASGWFEPGIRRPGGTGSSRRLTLMREGTWIAISSFRLGKEEMLRAAESLESVPGSHPPEGGVRNPPLGAG